MNIDENGRYIGPLYVEGHLDLSQTNLEFLPDGLHVLGDLNVSYTRLASLPAGLVVGQCLNVCGCELLLALPQNLRIKYALFSYESGIPAFLVHRGFPAHHHEGRIYAGCRNFTVAEAREHWEYDPIIVAALAQFN